jgi:hypothetical protein
MIPHSEIAIPNLLTYPARPVNGGRLEDAPPKVGPWIAQPKIKDWRGIVHTPTKRIWNRQGEPMSIEKDLAGPLMALTGCPFEWLDVGVLDRQNQLLRASIVVFDYIPRNSEAPTQATRREALRVEFNVLPAATWLATVSHRVGRVFLIDEYPVAWGAQDSAKIIYGKLRAANRDLGGSDEATDNKNFYEGIVCKRTDKPYPVQLLSPNKETPWMIKHRFDQ